MPGRVAIIGGGISGLSCAHSLKALGVEATVFDTGKRDVGGRCSTRESKDSPDLVFEHSAQVIVARDEAFLKFCENGAAAGLLRNFGGGIEVDQSGGSAPVRRLDIDGRYLFVGTRGMQSLTGALSAGLDLRRDVWVSGLSRKDTTGACSVREAPGEKFDAVVIAHNGKCADNLMSKTGASPRIHDLLKVSFGPSLRDPRSTRKMQLCSLYVLAFSGPRDLLPGGATARIVAGHPVLSWACNTSKKLGMGGSGTGGEHSYTLISTREYGANNKVPQEAIPPEKRAQVTTEMIRAAETLYGLPAGFISPSFTSLQLWGAAVPLNRHSAPCVWDGAARMAVCGDWFTPSEATRGPGIESAFLSGRRCAEAVARGLQDAASPDVGIEPGVHCFISCQGSPLGDVGWSGGASVSVSGPKLSPGVAAPPARAGGGAGAGAGAGVVGATTGAGKQTKRWVKK